MKNKIFTALTVLTTLFTLATLPAYAQLNPLVPANSFSIELIPTSSPGPGEAITARASSFSFDINRAQLTWLRNGQIQAEGMDLREYRFVTGDIGDRENLRVVAIDINGIRHETELSFIIADTALLWQADTSAPFWYKGKSLASHGSIITVSAVPNFVFGGRKILPQNLVYRWTLDENFKQSESGAGRNTFSFKANFSPGTTHAVSLEVSNLNQNIFSKKSVNISVSSPFILTYEYDALVGPKKESAFSVRRGDLISAGSEKSFVAEPFFFSVKNGRGDFAYEWYINDQKAEMSEPKNILNLKTEGGAGIQLINIEIFIKNVANILQGIKEGFQINVL